MRCPVAIVWQDIYEVNDREEAKNRAAQRMRGAPHETWTLIPGSDAAQLQSADGHCSSCAAAGS